MYGKARSVPPYQASHAQARSEPRSLFGVYAATLSSQEGGRERSALVREDFGSTDNIITHKFSAALRLPSSHVSLSLIVLGHQCENKLSRAYDLYLFDMKVIRQVIQAIGVDKLKEVEQAPEVWSLFRRFQCGSQEEAKAFHRPHNKVQLLLVLASW